MSRRSGFTLIELLVVIAIIAILAAILFPVLTAAKAAGNQSKCINNVKQIVRAVQLYSDDNTNMLLPGFLSTNWGDWYDKLNPYVRQMNKTSDGYNLRGIFLCPNIPRSRYPNGQEIPADLKRCYGYNYYYLGGKPASDGSYECHSSSELTKSSTTICIMEIWNYEKVGHSSGQASAGWGTAYSYPPSLTSLCSRDHCWPPGWHSGKTVVGWCDGHVSTVHLAPPLPSGTTDDGSQAYAGVMQKELNDKYTTITVNEFKNGKYQQVVYTSEDPYWRLKYFKP